MDSSDAIAQSVGVVFWEARLPDFAFTSVSASVEALFGYPRERWRERGFWAGILHPDDREDAISFCLAQTMARQPHEFDYRILAADGTVKWVRDIVVSVEDDEDGARLFGLLLDISGRRGESLARQRSGALDLPEGWGQATLVQGLAEALSAPLSAFVAGLGDGPAPAELAVRARGLLGIIEAGLADSQVGRGAEETGSSLCEPVQVADLAAEAARALGGEAAGAPRVAVDPSLAAPVTLHAQTLRRILFLMMLTAVLHGGPAPRLAIGLAGDRLRLAFDEPAAPAAARAPGPAVTIDAGRRRARDQALILAHVATLTDTVGGTLGIRLEPGRLAAIEVTLPFEWADPAVPEARPRLRVLYAEDDVINAQVMSELLKLGGIETEIAINGRDAVEMYGEDEFDLVLMDIRMPLMDGIEATRRIRADEGQARRRRTPIIGISAHASAEDVTRCLEAGMDAHIAKPVRLEELSEMIARFVPERAAT